MAHSGYFQKTKIFWNRLCDTMVHFLFQEVDEYMGYEYPLKMWHNWCNTHTL